MVLVGVRPADAAASSPSFLPPIVYGVGAQPYSVAVGDVTGDGVPDVVVSTGLGGDADFRDRMGKLLVFPGTSGGVLAAPIVLPTHDSMAQTETESQRSVVLGDFNGDGKLDAATVTPAGVDVYYQDSGMLSAPVLIPGTAGADNLAAGDINGDGKSDLVVEMVQPATQTSSISVLLSTGSGFDASTIWTGAIRPWSLRIGDLNGDGRPDIVASGDAAPVMFWTFIQQSDGTFAASAQNASGGACCVALALADLTGDGILDVASNGGGGEAVYAGTGTGEFAPPVTYVDSDNPVSLVGADMNGDGLTDLVVANGSSYPCCDASLSVLAQTASGDLSVPTTLPMPYPYAEFESSDAVSVGDLNGDRRPDVAVAELNTGDLVVFPQAGADTTPPKTTITGGPSGDTSASPTFSFSSSEGGGGFICSISGPSYAGHFWIPCTSPLTFTGLAAQTWTFTVAAVDAAGNVDPNPATRIFTVTTPVYSTTAPSNDLFANARALTGSSGTTSGDTSNASFEIGESQPSPSVQSPVSHSVWFAWRAPASGNVTLDTAASSFDTTLGVFTGSTISGLTPIASDVPGPMEKATLTFAATDGTTYRIQLDGWTHPQTGVTEAGPYVLTWNLIQTPLPVTTITSGPSGTVTSTSASFSFASGDSPVSFECSLDSGGWTACTSPTSYNDLAAGQHSFRVFATDSGGNIGPTASQSWTITAPAPSPLVSPSSVDFGSVMVGEGSGLQTITFTNTAGGPLTVKGWGVSTSVDPSDFRRIGGTCTTSTVLSAGQSCAATVQFTPTAVGSRSGVFRLVTNAGDLDTPLAGTGT